MSILSQFLDMAPKGTATTLAALACAESLTDQVAFAIYRRFPLPELAPEDFLSAFKYSGLTEPRNSEWNLIAPLREELVESGILPEQARKSVHSLLLELGENQQNRKKAGKEIPSYLFTEAGVAYHLAGAGNIDGSLEHYSRASEGAFTGAQWLGARLAEEQERTGVIPEGRIETMFLRAWVLFREGHKSNAMPLFRRVAATDREVREVAISLHILGNENNRGQRREAERELRRSIEIDGKLNNEFGVAQTLHSLANLLGRQDRFDEAEEAYRRSIEILDKLGNEFGVAQTLHSLANLLGRQDRFDEAEEAYRRSIEILDKLGNEFGVAQTLHSLANLLGRQDRFDEAEEAYRRSIEIDGKLNNEFGVAQTLHSLANLLGRQDRFDEAEEAYRRSIEVGEKIGNQFHVAQTLHSLAALLGRQDKFDEAERAYQRSIEIGRRLGNDNHLAQVLRSYALAVETRSPERAIELLEESLELNRRRGNTRFIRLVERTIEEVRKRTNRPQLGR